MQRDPRTQITVVGEGAIELLSSATHPLLHVAQRVRSVEESLDSLHPQTQVIVSDLELEGLDGMALVRLMRMENPDMPVLLLSRFVGTLHAEQALRAGAAGYLVDPDLDEVAAAIQHARSGGVYLAPEMWDRLLPAERRLAPPVEGRPAELLALMGRSRHGDRFLARRLDVSLGELEKLRQRLMETAGMSRPLQLMLLAQWMRADSDQSVSRTAAKSH